MKIGIAAILALISALALSTVAVAQASESAPDPSLVNPIESTSTLYTALSNAQQISQGKTLNAFPTLGAMEASGYLLGVKEMLSAYVVKPEFHICVPAGVSADTLGRIVVKFIDSNPKTYGWPPGPVVTAAYLQAFSCGK